jgi:hypothetical protein
MFGFTPIASMAIAGEELGMDPRMGRSACCGLRREVFFSGAVALSTVVDDSAKSCHIWGLPARSV